jgi:hypothetical protein
MLPALHIYLTKGQEKKLLPKSDNNLNCIKQHLGDVLLPVKLALFQSLAMEMQPLLTFLQSDDPLVPYLWRKYLDLVKTLCEKVVLPDVMASTTDLTKLDVTKSEVLLPHRQLKLGFLVNSTLSKLKVKDSKDLLQFMSKAKKCICTIISKLLLKCPLHYSFFKGASSFDPIVWRSPLFNVEVLELALNEFLKCNRISEAEGELICKEYKNVLESDNVKFLLSNFTESERLDLFWLKCFDIKKHPNLYKLLKLVCIMSHGNAHLERGFSINSNLVCENMLEQSLIAQRHIYEYVNKCNGPTNAIISKKKWWFGLEKVDKSKKIFASY